MVDLVEAVEDFIEAWDREDDCLMQEVDRLKEAFNFSVIHRTCSSCGGDDSADCRRCKGSGLLPVLKLEGSVVISQESHNLARG